MSGEEQNKSEEATPYKLERARQRGSVARGMDLGFFASLSAFLLFLTVVGAAVAGELTSLMRHNLSSFAGLSDPHVAAALVGHDWAIAIPILGTLGVTLLVIIIPIEVFQLRGLIFSAQPLKPDFTRLNPAKGFKRIFSVRTLKEALKNVLKFLLYGMVTALAIKLAVGRMTLDVAGARQFGTHLWESGMQLLTLFAAAALVLAAIDQFLVRREFARQMRMSRSEVTRESKDREGEPRIKAKRKQLHADYLKQTEGIGRIGGSDLLIVNPEHFAVALTYDPATMGAPSVRARARNRLALEMRREAARLNIPIFANPPLARALFRSTKPGQEIGSDHFRDVARLYSELRSRPQL